MDANASGVMPSDGENPTKVGSAELDSITDGDMGHLHRRSNSRQIQLIAAGGSIRTALFISIGGALAKGGPASLPIAFTLYTFVLALVNNSVAEMNTYMPVPGGFIRLAGYCVDDALGFLAGWNFFLYESFLIPFEITALNLAISFWSPEITDPGLTAGDLGRFEGFLACLVSAAFTIVGPEYISMVSAEAQRPSVYIKSAFIMSITFINYQKACVAQNVDRKTRPYYGYFQPYGSWIALVTQVTILFVYGYYSFRPWNVESFFQNYALQM
ncbi:amino acid permease-domain-containing protein [Dactylonectria macrodidyma]|uniref:Amino acid permease-domain-containing protein n=1 Tax=Dactylonectria macrodidyma TaxID=307937 RepID=A0A9P9IQK3_9HYPO|nr:amino acid permease-domain-containing protein [Dactylonectria macrodidyma]